MKTQKLLVVALIGGALTACRQESDSPQPADEEVARVTETGRAASKALVESLGGQLKGALQSGGPVGALRICQQAAGPMTTAAGQSFEGVTIRRTTSQLRNPANAPDEIDRKVLKMLEESEELPAEHLEWTGATGRFYKPLVIQEVCLKCHGDPADFSPELSSLLSELYPDDQATECRNGDFRGVIRVEVQR